MTESKAKVAYNNGLVSAAAAAAAAAVAAVVAVAVTVALLSHHHFSCRGHRHCYHHLKYILVPCTSSLLSVPHLLSNRRKKYWFRSNSSSFEHKTQAKLFL